MIVVITSVKGGCMSDAQKIEIFKEMLFSLRTISLKNAAIKLGMELFEITGVLRDMEINGHLRIVKVKGCSTSCSGCDTGSCEVIPIYTGDEVIISKLFDRTKEYVDE
jgi:hypothetical protein